MERQAQSMNVRAGFLRKVSIWFLSGLLVLAYFYFSPHINLPNRPRLNCPLLALIKPLSKAPVQATDSLEFATFDGMPGTPYTVRIYGDGRVERDAVATLIPGFTSGCPLHDVDKHLKIPPDQAIALISKARDGGFCRLCEFYQPTHPTSDGNLDQLTLTFHRKTNRVTNISNHPPPLFVELVNSFAALPPLPDYATTHHPTRERELECLHFMNSQLDRLKNRTSKH
jgi:hypothetical protein